MGKYRNRSALRATLLYGVFAGAWILLSDRLLLALLPDAESVSRLQTYKGWAFVAVTAVLLYAIVRDLTQRWERETAERKQAEEELRLKTTHLQTALGMADMGVWRRNLQTDEVLTVEGHGPISGLPEEVYPKTGRAFIELIHPEDRATVARSIERAKAGEDYNAEFRIVLPNGVTRWVAARGRCLRNAEGVPTVLTGVDLDITEQRTLEQQFRQAQKMEAIGQLAGGVAHDFNNVLAVIQMQAGLLEDDKQMTAAQREVINEIEKAAQRAANLTRQLLMFSRRQTMQARELDLNDLVGSITKMLQRILGEDIRMQFSYSPVPLILNADPGMVDQILLNLAVNSRDAMPKGGRLSIETSAIEMDELAATQCPQARPGSFACLSVSDTGCGIAPEVLPKIFEPFFTTKDVGKGTGLGLATVYGIVQQHQGWIYVYSEVGRGTTIRIYFPRLPRTQEQTSLVPQIAALRGGNETILVVEDDPALRRGVNTILKRLGYRVLEAPSGVSATGVWQQNRNKIRLLLTDMIMPDGMNGKELAENLLKEDPKLKVIYTSGYSADVAGKDFPLEDGVNFLAKPFEVHKLARAVRARLDS